MLKFLKNIFTSTDHQQTENEDYKIKVAAAALLIEASNSDEDFTKDEKIEVVNILKDMFEIGSEAINDLIELAQEKISESVSIYEFTDIINNSFQRNEKLEIMKSIWRLILSDKVIDKYEEQFARKVSNNLKLYHEDFISTKVAVKNELELS